MCTESTHAEPVHEPAEGWHLMKRVIHQELLALVHLEVHKLYQLLVFFWYPRRGRAEWGTTESALGVLQLVLLVAIAQGPIQSVGEAGGKEKKNHLPRDPEILRHWEVIDHWVGGGLL